MTLSRRLSPWVLLVDTTHKRVKEVTTKSTKKSGEFTAQRDCSPEVRSTFSTHTLELLAACSSWRRPEWHRYHLD